MYSMSENCVTMPPTINDRESSKSPTGNHSIDDILGIKASAAAQLAAPRNMYSGSDSSSDSSSNSGDTSPFPLENSTSPRQQQLVQVAPVPAQQQGKCIMLLVSHDGLVIIY